MIVLRALGKKQYYMVLNTTKNSSVIVLRVLEKKTITRSCHQSETRWDAQRLDSVKIQGCSVGISHHFMVLYPWIFHGNQRRKLNRTYKGALTSTRWCSPSYVCWFIIPLTIDISPTKTIVFGVICTNLAIERGHHLVGKYFLI